MTRRRALAAAAAALCMLAPVRASAVTRAESPQSISAPDEILITSQPFHIVSTVNSRFSLQFPAAVTKEATVQFLLQRRVANRDSFRAIADHFAEPGVIDSVSVPMRRGIVSGGVTSFDILMTTAKQATNDLNLEQPGVYPLTIRALSADGAVLASALTFLDRRDPAVASTATPVTVLGVLQAPVSRTTDGTIAIDDQSRALVQQYISFLGGIRSQVTLQVQPELVQALATSPEAFDNTLYEQLKAALAGRSLVTSTFLGVDAAALVHDGLSGEIRRQLDLGESTLARWLPDSPLHRTTWLATQTLDEPAVTALRRAGMKTVLLMAAPAGAVERQAPPHVIARPAGSADSRTAVVSVDEQLATTIDNAGNDPVRLGVRIAAEILTARDDLTARPEARGRTRMIVSSTTGDILDSASMSAAISHLSSAPGMSVQDLGGEYPVDAEAPVVNFLDDAGHTMEGLRNAVALARTELDAIGSMLPPEEPRRMIWSGSLAAASSPGTPEPSAYVDALRSGMRRLTGSVSLVTPDSIALSSRTGSIRLQIRNDDTAPLRVRVRMSSPKVSFATAQGVTELLPGATTEVAVPIRVRSNGRFTVTVRVITPTGRVQVVSPGDIEVRVTSVAGLGQLVSVTLLLVLLAWWWSHWRRSHRDGGQETTVADQ